MFIARIIMKLFSLCVFILGCCLPSFGFAANNLPKPSSTAQALFEKADKDLLKLRVLTKNGRSQSSVGSAFLIGNGYLAVTNFHVISQIALEPETYFGEYKNTKGESGDFTVLAVDVLHDLAIVRVNQQGTGFYHIPLATDEKKLPQLQQGENLYSLGNPLDLGFSITEGTYNGLNTRGFSEQYMFTGAVNPGMSGGPNITADGELAGINVAHRMDGELVSFLVPAHYAQKLLARTPADATPPADFKPMIGDQLLEHQKVMFDILLSKPFDIKELGDYRVPVRESDQVRCWGDSSDGTEKKVSSADISCSMESEIYVSDNLQTGHISMSHSYMRNKKLNAWQFSQLASKRFARQVYSSAHSRVLTPAACTENFVKLQNLKMRAQVCVEAYHKFTGLYDFTLITASSDDANSSLQSMMNIRGVAYDTGMKLIDEFLHSLSRAEDTKKLPTEKILPELSNKELTSKESSNQQSSANTQASSEASNSSITKKDDANE
jgi:serine protease Do